MFSGIVQQKSKIVSLEKLDGLTHFAVDLGILADGLKRGASVSLSGVCMTVMDIENHLVTFEAMGETLDKTTIDQLSEGAEVNIERSIRVGDEIGGHRVSGHITGMGEIIKLETPTNNHILTIRCAPAWMACIFPKGFIALDGCSLTVVDVGSDWFTVHLIPETLRLTTFGKKKIGDRVNLELDPETQAIVETVKCYLTLHASKP